MRYKAVIADVDGTLITPGEYPAKKPEERLVKAVRILEDKGIIFSLASARSLFGVSDLVEGLGLKSLIILDNGAKIYDCKRKKYIWESYLPREEAEKTLMFLKKDKSLPIIVVDEDERIVDLSKIKKWKISKIVVLDVSPQKAEELYHNLRLNPKIHVTRSISRALPPLESIHVTNIEATKQIAVLKFSEFLKIDTKSIIGIGDSYNDFPLLMACGLKIAMENATPDIKAIADFIAPSYEKGGVAYVLEKLIKKQLKPEIKSMKRNFKNHYLHNLNGEEKKQLLILVDKEGKRKGEATREECHRGKGKTHLAFMVFLFDKEGNLILTKRSKNKSLWPDYWDASIVSHVLSGETPEKAAKRRGKEELGIEVDFKDIGAFYYFAKHGNEAENEYCHVLVGRTDKQIFPNPVEIEAVEKINFSTLREKIRKNPDDYTPWLKLAFKKLIFPKF
jgi:isopentenyl-diphosphate delta-isomerase